MTDWVRLWHDMPTDPKWRVVARKSGQPLCAVISVFAMMLTNASGNAADRGTLLAWDHEDAGAALDLDADQVAAIYEAMQGKVLDGNKLSGWDRRQPKREDAGVSGRVARHRETKRAEAERSVTQCNAPETETETDSSVAKATGTVVPIDPEALFWTEAKAFLRKTVKGDPGALVARWLRDHRKEMTRAAINAAQLERAVDPVAYIEGYFRRQGSGAQAQPAVPL